MRRAGIALVLMAGLCAPVAGQLLPSVPVTEADVAIRPPHLVRVEPGQAQAIRVHVRAHLPCDGSPPPDLPLYLNMGRGYTEGQSGRPPVRVWSIEPDQVSVPWVRSDGGYAIDAYAVFNLTSDGPPSKDIDLPLAVSNAGQGGREGTCVGKHRVPVVTGQGAILAEAVEPMPTARTSPSPVAGAVLLLVLVAAALRGRRT